MTEQAVRALWREVRGTEPEGVVRLPTGNTHQVYSVQERGVTRILRMSPRENAGHLAGSISWLKQLATLDLPIPRVLACGLDRDPAYVILTYLPGRDLGEVYDELTEDQKKAIAKGLHQAQNTLARLPPAPGFGFLASYDDPSRKGSWKEVVLEHLGRSRSRITAKGYFDPALVDRVEARLGEFDADLAAVEPRPFFDDTTTKNLLVDNGRMSGIVDLDWLCFGDRLYVLALTRMSLLARNRSVTYVEYWAQLEGLNARRRRLLDLYTLVFCVDFMSEKGQRFNKDQDPWVSPGEVAGLLEVYGELSRFLDR